MKMNEPKGMSKAIGKGKAPSKGAVGAKAGGPKKDKKFMDVHAQTKKPGKA